MENQRFKVRLYHEDGDFDLRMSLTENQINLLLHLINEEVLYWEDWKIEVLGEEENWVVV